ncbi:alpha/beta fold hydrolase [Actinomadura kijaniata]|uniref:alpha/beta fold hydrolase n=1 Tax=Actinomadura kijaniata TaxID=46161 RepID=UPI003F1BBB17
MRDGADQAAWLAQALDGLASGPVHLAGVSIGGWTACNLALRSPGHVASLSLLDPACTFARFPPQVLLRTAATLVPGVSGRATRGFLRWVDGQGPPPADTPVARVIAAALEHHRVALPAPRLFTDDQLRRVTAPVLALIAGRSVMHDPGRAARRARALLPDARVEVWPEATHSIAGQYAAEVNERVLAFAAEAERAG